MADDGETSVELIQQSNSMIVEKTAENSCNANPTTEITKTEPKGQDVFKCELCEEEEFDCELYYRIHMKAHGSPSNNEDASCSEDDNGTKKGNETVTVAAKNKSRHEKNKKSVSPPKSSETDSDTGRYRLRNRLRTAAQSNLENSTNSKSRLKRSDEGSDSSSSSPAKKKKKGLGESGTRVLLANGNTSTNSPSKRKSAKQSLPPNKEQEKPETPPPPTPPPPPALPEPSSTDLAENAKENDTMAFMCPICSETLDTGDEESLCIHLGCHVDGTSQFRCIQCANVISDSWKEMQEHLAIHVDDSVDIQAVLSEKPENSSRQSSSADQSAIVVGRDPVICPQCSDAVFATMDEFDFHLDFHDDDGRIHCPFCSRVEESWTLMQPHLMAHPEVPVVLTLRNESRTCHDCKKMLENSDLLAKHSKLFHSATSSYHCETCGKRFFSLGRLACHRESHKSACYECSECQIQTATLQAMLEHQRIHQGLGVTCGTCQSNFPRQLLLEFHEKVHRKRGELTICDQCASDVHGTYALRYHMQFFHSAAPQLWPCSLCTYIGKTKNSLQAHMDHLHSKTCKCTKCEFTCTSEKMLARHMEMFHRPHKTILLCQLCSFRTEDAKVMTEHWRIRHFSKPHVEEKTFQCPTCKVQFKTQAQLKDHLPLHVNKKAYYCKLCVYSAKYRPTMYRHIMTKHPGYTMNTAVSVGSISERIDMKDMSQGVMAAGSSDISILTPTNNVVEFVQATKPRAAAVANNVATVASNAVNEVQILNLNDSVFLGGSNDSVALPNNMCLQFVDESGQSVEGMQTMQVLETTEAPKLIEASLGDGKTIQLLVLSEDLLKSIQGEAGTTGMQFFIQ